MTEKKQEAKQPWPPTRIWLPHGSTELAAVSPELQNVEGAWWVREPETACADQLTIWVCCHCQAPRFPGEEPCKCGKRLHDSVQYRLLPPPQIPDKQVAETAWLVEKGPQGIGQVLYICANYMLEWTDDPNKALRLSRREDAEAICSIVEDADRVAEHEWPALLQQQATRKHEPR